MVEKMAINNELLKMKNIIVSAKRCVLRKLVNKLRETKKELEASDTKPLKLATRPAKLNEQIQYLKNTGNFELATQCLVASKEPQQVLSNATADNDELALAHLRSFKAVAERVKQIRSALNLSAADEGWRSAVLEVGKKKQQKTQKEAHQKRKLEQKERQTKIKEAESKRSEWLAENQDGNKDGQEVGGAPAEMEVDVVPKERAEKKVKQSKETIKKEPAKAKPQKVLQPSKAEPSRVEEPEKPAAAPKRQWDSFFMTDSGSAYLATAEFEERVQPVGPNDGMDRRQRRAQMFGRSTASTNYNRPAARKPQPNVAQAPKKQFSTLTRPNFAGTAVRPAAAVDPIPTDLHPSWAAKQKTKTIANFTGRKTTFSDDADPVKPAVVAQPVRRANTGAAPTPSGPADDASKLHPSWAAKQKCKPVISEFKGKKITFGD